MDYEQKNSAMLYEDNTSAKFQTENSLHHKKTKYVDIIYHYTRQIVSENVVKLKWIDTFKQMADLMTKPLVKPVFEKLYSKLGMKTTKIVAINKV